MTSDGDAARKTGDSVRGVPPRPLAPNSRPHHPKPRPRNATGTAQGTGRHAGLTAADGPSGTVRVNVGGKTYAALLMSTVFASMLGYKLRHVPPVGTSVLVVSLSNRTVYVVGSRADTNMATPLVEGYAMGDETCPASQKELRAAAGSGTRPVSGDTFPKDLLDGEVDLRNAMDVGLSLLTGLTRMQAGGRAVIETHLFNDMVRIISAQFRHHSAMGDAVTRELGNRAGYEFHGSRFVHEVFGATRTSDKKDETYDKGALNPAKTKDEEGRARISAFVGHLGDFINVFVHDPGAILGATAAGPAGKFRAHVGDNGGLLIQSVADITLERVVRIPVPVRIRADDDPASNAPDLENLSGDPLKPWDYKDQDLHHACYQLREMSRWMSQYFSLSKFRQQTETWTVPEETDADQAPDPYSEDEEKQAQKTPEKYVDVYACIRIMRDGSIVLHDGYGGAVVMGGGDIRISAARNIHLQAAGNMVLEAGQNLLVKAGRSAEVTAERGEAVINSKTALRLQCEYGAVIGYSGAQPFTGGRKHGDKWNPDDPDCPTIQIPNNNGVSFTTNGGVSVLCRGSLAAQVDTDTEAPKDRPTGFIFQSPDGGFAVNVGRNFRALSHGYAHIKSGRDTIIQSPRTLVTSTTVALGGAMVLRNGRLDVSSLRAGAIYSNGLAVRPFGTQPSDELRPKNLGLDKQDTKTFSLDAELKPATEGNILNLAQALSDVRDTIHPGVPLKGFDYLGHLEAGDWHSGAFDYETLTQQWLRLSPICNREGRSCAQTQGEGEGGSLLFLFFS